MQTSDLDFTVKLMVEEKYFESLKSPSAEK